MERPLLVAIVIGWLGCGEDFAGDHGTVDFVPDTKDCGVGGCRIPWLSTGGARLRIQPKASSGCGSGATFASVSTSDSLVLTATKQGDGSVLIVSGAKEGKAELLLLDDNGGTVDSTSIVVAAAGEVDVGCGNPGCGSVLPATGPIAAGLTVVMAATAFSTAYGEGVLLYDKGAVSWASEYPIAGDSMPPPGDYGLNFGDDFAFHGSAAGSGTLTASIVAAASSTHVTFVDPASIDRILFLYSEEWTKTDMHGVRLLAAAALADETYVVAEPCIWQSAPAIHLLTDAENSQVPNSPPLWHGPQAVTPGNSGAWGAALSYDFVVTSPGSFAATCTIYGVSATTMITRTN